MFVQSKLVWEVSRYWNGGLAGGWWCGVTWSVRTCVGNVEGAEPFETCVLSIVFLDKIDPRHLLEKIGSTESLVRVKSTTLILTSQ